MMGNAGKDTEDPMPSSTQRFRCEGQGVRLCRAENIYEEISEVFRNNKTFGHLPGAPGNNIVLCSWTMFALISGLPNE